ncbi:ABC transporter permease [Marinoscillum sp. MHG1-6]|uniref:ABC transporter permease n=1 Tax=Marinoscillum sp. MHG1-6 TaxID=2959627 RepID=UPI00215809A9|nr:ABC transporter permease [Marinoscillum sp. MHG1-6]
MRIVKIILSQDTWSEILGSIRKNKVRTLITIVGVLWGIFIYIALSGSARGLYNGFQKEFESISVNSFFIWSNRTSVPYAGYKIGRRVILNLEDVVAIKKRVPEVEHIAPRIRNGNWGKPPARVIKGSKTGTYSVYGDFPSVSRISVIKIYDEGRFINQRDIEQSRKVCVIGERTQAELFEKGVKPVGDYIRIDGIYFQVIGVHEYSEEGGFSSDSDIFIPFSTYQKLYNTGNRVDWFAISAHADADIVEVEQHVKTVLKDLHDVSPTDERAIESFNLGQMFERITGFSKGMTFVSLVVGFATILAGVIGIGNILLISVKERTKELGIRRALGATPGEIRSLILLESVFLTLISGIMGIILGALTLAAVNNATQGIDFPYYNPTVPILWVGGALLIMVVLGSLIGLLPAQRALSIKPIEALREE